MKKELLPCPFCGGQPMVSRTSLSVYCPSNDCPQVLANESDNIDDAIIGWNTRHNNNNDYPAMQGAHATEVNWEQAKLAFSQTMQQFIGLLPVEALEKEFSIKLNNGGRQDEK